MAVKTDGVIVDFLLTAPGYEEQIIARAVRRNFNGFSVWVCSAEDLIIQKVIAGRDKDWPDVEALLIEQRGKLEEAYIENWLSQFAEALEKPELLAKYRRLIEKGKALEQKILNGKLKAPPMSTTHSPSLIEKIAERFHLIPNADKPQPKSKGTRKVVETQRYRNVFSFTSLCTTLAASRLCGNASRRKSKKLEIFKRCIAPL